MFVKHLNIIKEYILEDVDRFLILCLVFSLPFDRIPSIDIFGVTIRFSIVFGLLIILRTIYLAINGRVKPALRPHEKLILIFIAWLVLIIPESINFKRAFTTVASNFFVVAVAFCIATIFNKKYLKPIIYSLFASATTAVLFGIYQYIGDVFGLPTTITGLRDRYTRDVFGFPRIQSFSLEPLYFASYLLLPFSVALGISLFQKQKIISSKICTSLLFLFSFGIFLTVSRGGIYGLVASVVFMMASALILKKTHIKKALSLLVVIIIAFGSSLLVTNYLNKPPSEFTNGKKGANAYVSQIKNTGLEDGDERAKSRAQALAIIKEDRTVLFLGIGPGQYGPYVQNNKQVDGSWTIVNNLVLELVVETGIVGLLSIAIFIVAIFYLGSKTAFTDKDTPIAILALSICGYLASQVVQYQAYSTLYVVHLWVAIGLLLALLRYNAQNK